MASVAADMVTSSMCGSSPVCAILTSACDSTSASSAAAATAADTWLPLTKYRTSSTDRAWTRRTYTSSHKTIVETASEVNAATARSEQDCRDTARRVKKASVRAKRM
eukprot:scaffold6705_cov31-Tisochrysis_lutea.AAC.6